MVKKLLYFILATLLLVTIYLTIFELLIYNFHSPFNSNIKEPIAHHTTWIYLLKQHYITFIELDIFNIHEKRHLLDVKKVFEKTYIIWLMVISISSIITLILMVKFKDNINKSLIYLYRIGFTINILLITLNLNFLNSFSYFHTLFFTKNTWTFPKNSILIEWFPLSYFQEFFSLFLILTFSLFFFIRTYAKIPHEYSNNRR